MASWRARGGEGLRREGRYDSDLARLYLVDGSSCLRRVYFYPLSANINIQIHITAVLSLRFQLAG